MFGPILTTRGAREFSVFTTRKVGSDRRPRHLIRMDATGDFLLAKENGEQSCAHNRKLGHEAMILQLLGEPELRAGDRREAMQNLEQSRVLAQKYSFCERLANP